MIKFNKNLTLNYKIKKKDPKHKKKKKDQVKITQPCWAGFV